MTRAGARLRVRCRPDLQGLSRYVGQVDGVDIAESMVRRAGS